MTAVESYDAGPVDISLLHETIGANLERTVLTYPDADALVDASACQRWTYAQLNNEIDSLARALIASGIERGDRVGIWAPNRPEWVLLQYATAKIGAILVTVNPAYRTHELSYVLRHSATRLLVSASSRGAFRTSDYRGMVEQVRPGLPELHEVVFLGTDDWEQLRQRAEQVPHEQLRSRTATLRPSDPINIQYTSGTTGSPKAVTLSHRNILNNGFFVTELLGLGPETGCASRCPSTIASAW